MTAIHPDWRDRDKTPIDFLLVGAGAGGAPLAARLVERGYTVLLLDMGPAKPDKPANAHVENTDVPLLHPEVTEDPRHALRFFVNHYDTDPQQSIDPKVQKAAPNPNVYGSPVANSDDEKGVFYPRAQGLGGCTVHNAMITIAGPGEDWDHIAEATGDESWRGPRVRSYFERLERCWYNRPTFFGRVRQFFGLRTGWEGDRHGTNGWLDTTLADLSILGRDPKLFQVVLNAAKGSLAEGVENFGEFFRGLIRGRAFPALDPNHWETQRKSAEGLVRIPTAIAPDGVRSGVRGRLDGLRAEAKARLLVLTGACATGIEFAPGPDLHAVGVRVLPREHTYEADPNATVPPADWQAQQVVLFCRREVVLCGGAFNTPQLLMLSGIGPKEHLAEHGIECRAHLPGVGQNLQDRYEVPVVGTVNGDFESLRGIGSTSRNPVAEADPALEQWRTNAGHPASERGPYATNGGLIGIFKRTTQEDAVPDLFIFALPGYFPGYHVGYSRPAAFARLLTPHQAGQPITEAQRTAEDQQALAEKKRTVTWLILKARTRQHGGEVRLRSASPFRRPEINFRSFPLGAADPDARALVEGVQFVQRFLERGVRTGLYEKHDCPGFSDPAFGNDLNVWVRNVAWGHHACGTCKIGRDGDPNAVLDSRFRVRGVAGLRVVDASVFPRIPGVFIVTNIYMAAEKAADVLTEDHPVPVAALPPDAREALARDPVLRSRPEYEARRVYPVELEAREAELVTQRRRAAGYPQAGGS